MRWVAARSRTLGEATTPAAEQRMLDNVIKRVRLWKEVEPFYPTKGKRPKDD